MTAQTDPYVRVYYRIIDDPKFETVFDDKTCLGWWLTLLLGADATYPAPANLPRRLPDKILANLVDAGLVDHVGADRYRVHGLSAEREHRSEQSSRAANARWQQSGSNAPALRQQSSRDASPNRTAPIRSTPVLIKDEEPFGTLSPEDKEKRRQRDRDELMARTMERLGVKP